MNVLFHIALCTFPVALTLGASRPSSEADKNYSTNQVPYVSPSNMDILSFKRLQRSAIFHEQRALSEIQRQKESVSDNLGDYRDHNIPESPHISNESEIVELISERESGGTPEGDGSSESTEFVPNAVSTLAHAQNGPVCIEYAVSTAIRPWLPQPLSNETATSHGDLRNTLFESLRDEIGGDESWGQIQSVIIRDQIATKYGLQYQNVQSFAFVKVALRSRMPVIICASAEGMSRMGVEGLHRNAHVMVIDEFKDGSYRIKNSWRSQPWIVVPETKMRESHAKGHVSFSLFYKSPLADCLWSKNKINVQQVSQRKLP